MTFVIFPRLKGLTSPDVDQHRLPASPDDCAVVVHAEIGPSEGDGADLFSFQVVTPRWLLRAGDVRWGRGLLIVEEFSWPTIEHDVKKLLLHTARGTWPEVAAEIAKELHWEFENYPEAR
jgi:hypothetical protein